MRKILSKCPQCGETDEYTMDNETFEAMQKEPHGLTIMWCRMCGRKWSIPNWRLMEGELFLDKLRGPW